MSLDPKSFCQNLSERLRLSGYRGVELVDGCAVRAFRPRREIFIYVWPEGAMSVVFREGTDQGKHLNYWACRDFASPTLLDDMWEVFWAHEKENAPLGRIQWMHGPVLVEPVVETEVDVFSMFGAHGQ